MSQHSTPDDEILPYEFYVGLSPADSLRLGVLGLDQAAADARLSVALAVQREYVRVSDAAYGSAHWMSEPTVEQPFGLQLTIRHGGDVLAVLADPELRIEMRDHLGFTPHEAFIRDEDGDRWEWNDGGAELPENRKLIEDALQELRDDIGREDAPSLDAIISRWEELRADLDRPASATESYVPAAVAAEGIYPAF